MTKNLITYAKALGKESTAKLTFADMLFYHEWVRTGKLSNRKKKKK